MSRQDEGIDQEEANFYHDERRQRLAHEGNRMSNIEPTEEQKQAARDLYNNLLIDFNMGVDIRPPEALARLLAEREAKLREELNSAWQKMVDLADRTSAHYCEEQRLDRADLTVAQARVAELEASNAHLRKLLAEERGNVGAHSAQHLARIAELEAENDMLRVQAINKGDAADRQRYQHLADIKAAKDALEQARPSVEAWVTSDAEDVDSDADALQAIDEVLARLAHYDDAKAAEGGEG